MFIQVKVQCSFSTKNLGSRTMLICRSNRVFVNNNRVYFVFSSSYKYIPRTWIQSINFLILTLNLELQCSSLLLFWK
ncbi:Os02g0293575 [Oryza sativa Japonica Group]|uniref:Os02g0293575 protein n=1 Tax=Oryza sativa subsp. japonica TaxID=39947 RepID=A0A0P0VHU0_ORYSJ|nr:hypothetical protein EE612_010581 [Oryza sativa]BAS78206.1 Os02g0293575 [Oryza sativa Japonica Group]